MKLKSILTIIMYCLFCSKITTAQTIEYECSCEGGTRKSIIEDSYGNTWYRHDALPKTEVIKKIFINITKHDTIKLTKIIIKRDTILIQPQQPHYESGLGNSIPQKLQPEKPIYSTVDKQTYFEIKEDGKTIIPYNKRTFYDKNDKPLYSIKTFTIYDSNNNPPTPNRKR